MSTFFRFKICSHQQANVWKQKVSWCKLANLPQMAECHSLPFQTILNTVLFSIFFSFLLFPSIESRGKMLFLFLFCIFHHNLVILCSLSPKNERRTQLEMLGLKNDKYFTRRHLPVWLENIMLPNFSERCFEILESIDYY